MDFVEKSLKSLSALEGIEEKDSLVQRSVSKSFNGLEFTESFYKLPLGLVMSHRKGSNSICVSGFVNIAASRQGNIHVGDELISVNGTSIEGMKSKSVLKIINSSTLPLTIVFRRHQSELSNFEDNTIEESLPKSICSVESDYNVVTVKMIQDNAQKLSKLVDVINDTCDQMKVKTGVGNDAIQTINFSKISSFRDHSAGLGYRLDIALEKLLSLERKYYDGIDS